MISCSRKVISDLFQAVGVKFSMESTAAHAEFFCGFSAIAIGLFKSADDQLFFSVFYDKPPAASIGRRRGTSGYGWDCGNSTPYFRRKIARCDLLRAAKDNRSFNRGAQFADISGPWIIQQPVHRIRCNLANL